MRNSSLWLCSLLVTTLAGSGWSQPHSNQPRFFDSEPEWRLTDPAYLYLRFKHKPDKGDSLTWIHPIRNRSGWCEEVFIHGQEGDARAFAFRLTRETPQGYEVSFQPIEPTKPWIKHRLPIKDVRVFFPRSKRRLLALTNKLSVLGFYGDPQLQRQR